MGRTKYTQEAVNAIMKDFVKATKSAIEEDGIESASIRRVSAAAGYSSATLYLYFEDMNELVSMSLISSLHDYVRDVIESTPEDESPEDLFMRSWELFSMHAFRRPSEFLHLFFGPQSENLDAIAAKYYELFPEELDQAEGHVLKMLASGSLKARHSVVLDNVKDSVDLADDEIDLANDIIVAYFHSLLAEAAKNPLSDDEQREAVNRFMKGMLFVLRK